MAESKNTTEMGYYGSMESSLSAEVLSQLRPEFDSGLPKVRQLYLKLYAAIERGHLPYDAQLPASRTLSKQLNLARNTVIHVYEQLTAEGLLSADGRRGTRVARRLTRAKENTATTWSLSTRSAHIHSRPSVSTELTPGEPDSTLFPQTVFRKSLAAAAHKTARTLGYHPDSLRYAQDAIARYLATYRSLVVDPERIVVTSSTRQSLTLAAHLFADSGDTAWVECPGYLGAVDAFRQAGLQVRPCRLDDQGLVMPGRQTVLPRIIYLTPCFQYPLGMPLGLDRRRALLDWSRRHGSVLFEDDYDSEFRDDSQPRPALAADAAGARVLHAGTFSKILFPAIRVGWLVVPGSSVIQAHRCLRAIGGGNNIIAQAAVAELLDNGSIARHLRRARLIYGQRRRVLMQELNGREYFEPVDQLTGSLSLVLPLTRSVPIDALESALKAEHIGAQPIEQLEWDQRAPKRCKALIVGLGNVESLALPQSVNRLVAAVKRASSI